MARRGDGIYQRGKTWWLDFMHQGQRHVLRIGRNINKTAAGEIARVKRAAILKGEAGISMKPPADISLEKGAELYLERYGANLKPNSRRRYETSLERLKAAFPGQKLLGLSPLLLERYKRDRQHAGDQPATVNRDLEVLRSVCNRLVAWGKLARNPVRLVGPGKAAEPGQVAKLKEPEGRVRFLSPEEEKALLDACHSPQLRAVIVSGIHAGLRIPSEALSLTWENVDLKRGSLTVLGSHSKNAKTRTIPLNAVLRDALQSLRMGRQGKEGPVFVKEKGPGKGSEPLQAIRTAFDTARRKAKLGEDVTPHVLRHTFTSRLAMAGVDLRTIQELGGWASLDMVMRYSHLCPSHKAAAVEKIAGHSPTVFTTPGKVVALNA